MNAPTMIQDAGFRLNENRKTGLNSTIQITDSHANGLLQRPRLQVCRSRHAWSPRMPSQMTTPYAQYRSTVLTDVMPPIRNSGSPPSALVRTYTRRISSQLARLIANTALLGVRQRLLTRLSQPLPGIPSSRLNANNILPADAIDEKPQKVIAN